MVSMAALLQGNILLVHNDMKLDPDMTATSLSKLWLS